MRSGHMVQVDSRSYRARGLDIEPGTHDGPRLSHIKRELAELEEENRKKSAKPDKPEPKFFAMATPAEPIQDDVWRGDPRLREAHLWYRKKWQYSHQGKQDLEFCTWAVDPAQGNYSVAEIRDYLDWVWDRADRAEATRYVDATLNDAVRVVSERTQWQQWARPRR